jgi:UDP:flavonoid glycosyltransferase YjiC (YdhE family)
MILADLQYGAPSSRLCQVTYAHSSVILVNQGTVAGDIDMLIHPAIEGLKDENAIVLAVPVRKGEILDLPKNTYVESFIPFGNLLPHIDIMVTNGGFGGTQNALAHGIPLVIAGATEDKMEVAARVEYCGAGINLRKQKPSPQEVRQAVVEVQSDPSYKKAARRVQADFAKYDAPTLAMEFIEELLRTHGTLDPA